MSHFKADLHVFLMCVTFCAASAQCSEKTFFKIRVGASVEGKIGMVQNMTMRECSLRLVSSVCSVWASGYRGLVEKFLHKGQHKNRMLDWIQHSDRIVFPVMQHKCLNLKF